MLSFNDRTYCASPNCTNECGRKMTADEKEKLAKSNMWVSTAYFCDVPEGYSIKDEQPNA